MLVARALPISLVLWSAAPPTALASPAIGGPTMTATYAKSSLPVVATFDGHAEVDGLLPLPGIGWAGDRFAGQVVAESGGFEVVSGIPTSPLTPLVPGTHDGTWLFQNEIQGVANGTAVTDIGEGAVSFWFEADHASMGLSLNKMNGGAVTLQFFERDGTPFDPVVVSHAGNADLTFTSAGDERFAGVTMTNVDSSGVAYDELRLGTPSASATSRNAGSNPDSHVATTLPVLGTTYTAAVDPSTTGHTLAALLGFLTPATIPLPDGQTILCNIADPFGELLALGPQSGPNAVFQVPIPSDPVLAGLGLCTQAVHLLGAPSFALSNAQDLVLGY